MREIFLILCREYGSQARNLREALQAEGQVVIIPDTQDADHPWFSDAEMDGFGGLVSHGLANKSVTAWERAWKWLSLNPPAPDERVWFIEDDVAGSAAAFQRLIYESAVVDADLSATEIFTKRDDLHWYHWSRAEGWFSQPARSFNPICRLSPVLVAAVLRFRDNHGRFIFHEILFPSVLSQIGLPYLDWNKDTATAPLLKSFRYRPALESFQSGICHPVKCPDLHRSICLG